jgi:hypothetical protein
MRTTWSEDSLTGWRELSTEEMSGIAGGESLWYWIGYGVGTVARYISELNGVQSGGQKLMNSALG